jgi:CRISP-associated protein Cas1
MLTPLKMTNSETLPFGDDFDWLRRTQMWQKRALGFTHGRAKRERPRTPLILSGHGVSLRIENGALTIRNGFTHYPQKQEIYRYFKGEPSIPECIVMLDGSGSVSFDVLSWLSEQDISLIRLDWRGEIVCVASRSGYAANPYRVQWQREMRSDHDKRMAFCVSQITKKIEASIHTLEKVIRKSGAWERAMRQAYSTLTRLDESPPTNVTELRALEANAAAAYFRAWRGIPTKWRGTSRRPIPEAWKSIEQRTSPFQLAGNRNAAHPVNAILNYAYAVLQSQIQINAVAEGYDPTIGIMHEKRDGSSAFIFDLMEPERPATDRKVLEFIKGHVFDPADFTIRSDGVCRLNPEMARCVVGSLFGIRTKVATAFAMHR